MPEQGETLEQVRERLNLLPKEMDRAFHQARQRTIGAGYDHTYRQLKRITGQGKTFWLPNRVYAGVNLLTGDGRVWVGLNPARVKNRTARVYKELPEQFDPAEVEGIMTRVLEGELEIAARQIIRGYRNRGERAQV